MRGEPRRRFSLEQKRALVLEAEQPGATVRSVARRHGLEVSLLYRWRRALCSEGEKSGAEGVRFVPVRVASGCGGLAASGGVIEVVLRNGRCLRVPAGLEAGVLARLAAALEG